MNFDEIIYQHTGLRKTQGESFFYTAKKERFVNRRSFGECLSVFATEHLRMENDRLDMKLVSVALTANGESAAVVGEKIKEMGGAVAEKVNSIFKVMIEFFTQMGRGISGLADKAGKTVEELKSLGNIPSGTTVVGLKHSYRSKNLTAGLKSTYEKMNEILEGLNKDYKVIDLDKLGKMVEYLDSQVMDYSDLKKKGKTSPSDEDVKILVKEYIQDLSTCKELGPIMDQLKKNAKSAQKAYMKSVKKAETKEVAGTVRTLLFKFNKSTGKLYGYTLKLVGYEISNSSKIIKAVKAAQKKSDN